MSDRGMSHGSMSHRSPSHRSPSHRGNSTIASMSDDRKYPQELTSDRLGYKERHEQPSPSMMDRFREELDDYGRFAATGEHSSVHRKEIKTKKIQRQSLGHDGYYRHQNSCSSFTGPFSRSDAYQRPVATGQYDSRYQKEKEKEMQRKQRHRESLEYDRYYGRN